MDWPLVLSALFIWSLAPAYAATSNTGFLVIAPDRGFLGNQEIHAVFEDFRSTYAPASLIFVGRGYAGVGTEYSDYVHRALRELEEAGAKDLVAIPFFLSDADPILQRVKASLPSYGHSVPIRWAASMADSYLIAQVVLDRATALSREPAREAVILIAHGDKSDQGNAKWLSVMQTHIEQLKRDPHCAQLKTIRAATVREDWPEQREKAVQEVRAMIQDASNSGRALVIADRLYGAGPYKKLFDGLDYSLNDKGLAHPMLTQWLETGIARMTSILAGPLSATDPRTVP